MPTTEIEIVEIYNVNTGEVITYQFEVTIMTPQEIIQSKEEELIKIYNDIEILRASI
jgi:hypothetical protein